MESNNALEALAALAHSGRMAVFRLLVRRYPDGVQPSEIAACLRMPRNTLSAHLTVMKHAGLLVARREGRAIFYRIDIDAVGGLIRYMTADCCRGRPDLCAALQMEPLAGDAHPAAADRPLNVLFVCTRNAARSIFAEAILARDGGKAFRAYSAGTRPQSGISPMALDLLREKQHPLAALRSKDVGVFRSGDAPTLDFVFTVCDRAANEDCPPWPGSALTAHWGIPDPIDIGLSQGQSEATFRQAYELIEARVAAFLALPLRALDRRTLQQRLDDIGRLPAT